MWVMRLGASRPSRDRTVPPSGQPGSGQYRRQTHRLSGHKIEPQVSVRAELTVFAFLALLVLYLCGICIYYLEHDAQPDRFRSALEGSGLR